MKFNLKIFLEEDQNHLINYCQIFLFLPAWEKVWLLLNPNPTAHTPRGFISSFALYFKRDRLNWHEQRLSCRGGWSVCVSENHSSLILLFLCSNIVDLVFRFIRDGICFSCWSCKMSTNSLNKTLTNMLLVLALKYSLPEISNFRSSSTALELDDI